MITLERATTLQRRAPRWATAHYSSMRMERFAQHTNTRSKGVGWSLKAKPEQRQEDGPLLAFSLSRASSAIQNLSALRPPPSAEKIHPLTTTGSSRSVECVLPLTTDSLITDAAAPGLYWIHTIFNLPSKAEPTTTRQVSAVHTLAAKFDQDRLSSSLPDLSGS